jgi:hypothetical protein
MTHPVHPGFLSNPAEAPFRETRFGWLVLAAVWVAGAGYLAFYLKSGFWPLDGGAFGAMAMRVLHGQVPHRDFGEIYTGGMTYLNALSFRLFGANLFSLRIPLLLLFLGWVPAVYFIARRFARPLGAGAATLLAVIWSVPNYPEAMPSWYNLFFATWGVLALIRYTEKRQSRWLWLAGLAAGFSFLIKIAALYFIAAALLFFLFHEQSAADAGEAASSSRGGGVLYRLFVTAGLLLFLIALVRLVSERPDVTEFTHFVLPSACLVAFLLWECWSGAAPPAAARFRRLFSMAASFFAGALLPLAIFLAWYARQNALHAWFEGVFILPTNRTHWSAHDAVSLLGLAGLLPALLLVLLSYDRNPSIRRLARYGAPVLLGGLLLAAWKSPGMHQSIGVPLALLVPLFALAAPFCLRRSARLPGRTRLQAFLVVAAGVTCALIQYPISDPVYFCYVAPLEILAILALFSLRPPLDVAPLGSIVVFYLVFAVWLHTSAYFAMTRATPGAPLSLRTAQLERADGIRMRAGMASKYERLVRLVREHARGRYIYATPDCPEVYFLSGYRDATGTLLDFLDRDFLAIPQRTHRILGELSDRDVGLVVLKNDPQFSGPVPAGLRAALDARFPRSAQVDDFEVRWKP